MAPHRHSWTFYSEEGDRVRYMCTRCEATITKLKSEPWSR